MTVALAYQWSGEGWEPLRRFRAKANETFVIGELATLEKIEERSSKSHAHFFASLHDAWATLPDGFSDRFATPEHLRKYLLIKTGFHDHRQHVCHTRGEAVRLRTALAPMDSYAIVTLTGCVVDVYTAQSMSSRAMDKKRFQEAKTAILDELNGMLGTRQGDLEKQGEVVAA